MVKSRYTVYFDGIEVGPRWPVRRAGRGAQRTMRRVSGGHGGQEKQ